MARIGQAYAPLIAAPRALWFASGVAAALAIALWIRGFEIDDALISVRYAHHLASGVGYRFNTDGASTDGVTPLAWPFVLAPFSRGSTAALDVLDRARVLSAGAWLLAAGAWGAAVGRAQAHVAAKLVAFALLAMCVPVAAHAVSGMETGVAIALATFASIAESAWAATVLAGICASLRPEMAPWALAIAVLTGPIERAVPRVLVAIAPFAIVATIRFVAFGHVAPLAVLAKPSDLQHGLVYVAAAALVSLAPVAAFAPFALFRRWDRAAVLFIAAGVHFAAIVAVGGDWMPYARFAAPIAPSLLYAFVLVASRASRASSIARGVLALALAAYVLKTSAPRGRHVEANVRALVDRARPLLAHATHVAAVDIGWVSAATDASIVDLAGLTDPEIASLAGGHTSKRVDASMLLARGVDAILLFVPPRKPCALAAWAACDYAHVVAARIASSPLIEERFEARAFLPYADEGAGYVLLERKE